MRLIHRAANVVAALALLLSSPTAGVRAAAISPPPSPPLAPSPIAPFAPALLAPTSVTTPTEKIVFVYPQPTGLGTVDANIWIMADDGSQPTQLTTYTGEDLLPDLSPDGTRVSYFSRRADNGLAVRVMHSDGTNDVELPLPVNSSAPTWSPDGNYLAFASDSEHFWEVWVVEATGANPHRVTTHSGAAGNAAWSPDGQQLVYEVEPSAGYYDIYTVTVTGTAPTLIVSASGTGYSNHLPAWSPAGGEFATVRFPAGSSGPYDLWLMDTDGANGRTIVEDVDHPHLNQLTWSPDGQWLVFVKGGRVWRTSRDGSVVIPIGDMDGWQAASNALWPNALGEQIVFADPHPDGVGENAANIWSMDLDGQNRAQLTNYVGEDRWPALSPDGSTIVWASRHADIQQLWHMDSDGLNKAAFGQGGNNHRPTWSSDGAQIAFESDLQDFWEVWVMDADGSNAARLTTHAGAAGSPSWSPDGQQLVYQAYNPGPGTYDLFTVTVTGLNPTLIYSGSLGYSNVSPAWSPTRAELATIHFPTNSGGPYDLWLMDLDGSNGQVLVEDLDHHDFNNLAWTGDGEWLLFNKAGQVWRVNRDGTGAAPVSALGGYEPSTNALTLPVTVQFSSAAYSVTEAAGSLPLTVTLSSAAAATVAVTLTTTPGSAGPADFAGLALTLIFTPGVTSLTAQVPITNDLLAETTETFTLTLAAPVNAGLGSPAQSGVTLLDDDPARSITGRVTSQSGGAPVAGVTLTFTNGFTATTGATGLYARAGFLSGAYRVTPSLGACTFTPAYRDVVVGEQDLSAVNFVADCPVEPITSLIYLPVVAKNTCPAPQFSDPFDNPASGWPHVDTGSVVYQYTGGEYRLLLRNPNWSAGASPGVTTADALISADVHAANGVYGSFGVLFGLSDNWSQFYLLEIDTGGYFVLWRFGANAWTALAGGNAGFLNHGTATNHLAVRQTAGQITAYANGQQLASVPDGAYTGPRRVGVMAFSYATGDVDARFDNYLVRHAVCDLAPAAATAADGLPPGITTGTDRLALPPVGLPAKPRLSEAAAAFAHQP